MLYRSKPQEVEAIQWLGNNVEELSDFEAPVAFGFEGPDHALWCELQAGKHGAQGLVPVPVGHWIVRQPGDYTDHWPVDPDYFAAKYEPAT